MVAGKEYGDLFGYVVEGLLPIENLPTPRTVESDQENATGPLKDRINDFKLIAVGARSNQHKEKLKDLERTVKGLENEYAKISEVRTKITDLALQEAFKAEVREIIAKKN